MELHTKENIKNLNIFQNGKICIDSIIQPDNLIDVAKFLTSHENISSKRWIFEQYDSMVGTANMSTNNPTDAGVVNIKGTNKALAMTVIVMRE